MSEKEIRVKIAAQDETQPAIKSAESGVDELEEKVENGFERVAERLSEYFAAEKIVEFVKDSISEFAKLERAFDILGAQVRANGENWSNASEGVEEFVKSEEQLYGFTRAKVLESLTDAETKVKNLGAALKVSDEAQKLSVATGQDLRTTTDALALSYEGNSRGLMELGRILGLDRDKAKDVEAVFKALGSATKDLGNIAEDSQGQLNNLSSAWEDTKENFGRSLFPLIGLFSLLEKAVASVFVIMFQLAGYIDDVIYGTFQALDQLANNITDSFLGLAKILTGNVRDGFQQITRSINNSIDGFKNAFSFFKDDAIKATNDLNAIWSDGIKKRETMSDAEFAALAKKNNEQTDRYKKDQEKKIAEFQKENKKMEEITKKFGDHEIKEAERVQKAKDKIKHAELTSAIKLADNLISLSSSHNKTLVKIAKQAGALKAIINTAVGVSQALAQFPYPYDLVVAAMVGVEGALQVAKIEGVAFAEGGVVTGPTHALIGEAGEPEAVVPLSKAGEMGFGGQTVNHFHLGGVTLPGVRNATQFANELPGALQRMQTRMGQRFTGAVSPA